jgi:putative ABC transport system permease protein
MRLYRALLHLYPASFRSEYGDDMCAIFARRLRDANGPLATIALWVDAALDTSVNAARVHVDILRQDVKYALRSLARSCGFTVTAILVAALGIGATTAVFSIADHVLIRPLPFAHADRLVKLWQSQPGYARMETSPPNYDDWKRMSRSFESMGAYTTVSVNLVGTGEPMRLDGAAVTAELWSTLGVRPALGRVFAVADDVKGAPGTLLLSDRLWRLRFHADPAVVGRKVILDDEPFVVVGVMPPDFYFPTREVTFWAPFRFGPQDFQVRDNWYLRVAGKLRRGVSLRQARAEMQLIASQLAREHPKENRHTSATVIRLRDEVSEQARLLLVALVGASLCVLLIACSNLASLLLTRAIARERELAVRTALGAGRERLVRQMLTESVMLALCGGLLGVLLAISAAPLVARLVPNALPIAEVPEVNLRMLAWTALLTIGAGIGFGVMPAFRMSTSRHVSGLRDGARAGVSRYTDRLRSGLVIAEVTASVVLLVSAGLLIRALWRVQEVDPGFRAESVLTLRTALPTPKYDATARRAQFYQRVLSEIRTMPGVSSAAYISFLPMVFRGGIWRVEVEGSVNVPEDSHSVSLRFVTPGFFASLGVPVHQGRDVSDADTGTAPAAAVVSDSFARLYWPGRNPIGRHFQVAFRDRTVVGVVGDIRVRGLERSSEPQVYLPYQQVDDGWLIWYVPKDLVIRTELPVGTLMPSVRQVIARADPELPISDVQMLSDVVNAETAPRRVQIRVLAGFAAVAALLAAVGIYGVLAFSVSTRTREIGVRIALGAQGRDILAMIVRHAVALAASGVALGLVVAFAAGRAMQALLAGVSPSDATTVTMAVGLSMLMTVAGSVVPAVRAVRTDPLTAIRLE